MAAQQVRHDINPVFDGRSRVLLLGTMPSPASREAGFFYGHPRNRFWRVLAAIFDEPVPRSVADKRDLLARRRIALWDVLASCAIEGASDASIADPEPNDIGRILNTAQIEAVLCTGAKAGELYRKLVEPQAGMACEVLPSTSPANAKMSLDDLTRAYRAALMPHLEASAFEPPALDVPDVVRLEQAIAGGGTSLRTLMDRAGRWVAKAVLDEWAARRDGGAYARSEEKEPLRKGAEDGRAAGTCDGPNGSGKPKPNGFDGSGPNASDGSRGPLSRAQGLPPRVTVLCGAGNNGGDGWVAACELARAGAEVALVTPRAAADISAEPAREAALEAADALAGGCIVVSPDASELASLLGGSDAIVDAMLGTGFSGDAVREPFASWIRAANAARASGAFTVAADVPSGLSAQTGRAAEPCMKADVTVTMLAPKPGLVTPYAFAFCGRVRTAPIADIEPILSAWATRTASQPNERAHAASSGEPSPAAGPRGEFLRAEAEDDDGYDPYSDRPPAPEPLFQRDPWD